MNSYLLQKASADHFFCDLEILRGHLVYDQLCVFKKIHCLWNTMSVSCVLMNMNRLSRKKFTFNFYHTKSYQLSCTCLYSFLWLSLSQQLWEKSDNQYREFAIQKNCWKTIFKTHSHLLSKHLFVLYWWIHSKTRGKQLVTANWLFHKDSISSSTKLWNKRKLSSKLSIKKVSHHFPMQQKLTGHGLGQDERHFFCGKVFGVLHQFVDSVSSRV